MTNHENNQTQESKSLPDEYELSVSNPSETGLRLYNLYNSESDVTGVFVEFNQGYDVHAAIPWAGARTSRSDDPHEQIYGEIKDVSHAKKIDMFFGYGHASIANMSPLMLHLNNIPMSEAYWIFNHLTLVGGQESSTRYIELSNPTVTNLEKIVDLDTVEKDVRDELVENWKAIQQKAHDGFAEWQPRIEERLADFVRTHDPDVKEGAMSKRALDAARAWLPFGGRTSMSLQFDVREAINLVSQLNQRGDYYGDKLADHLTKLIGLKQYEGAEDLQADLVGLLKYSQGYDTIERNAEQLARQLESVPEFEVLVEESISRIDATPEPHESTVELTTSEKFTSPGDEVIAGYVSTLLPNVPFYSIVEFTSSLQNEVRQELLATIFAGHTQHKILRNAADIRGHTVDIETALAYQRDFNRHRAMGRIATMLETNNFDAVIRSGFNRSHVLSGTEVLQDLEGEWNEGMASLYNDIYAFYEKIKTALGSDQDYSFIYHILPLGHQSKLIMSGPLMQWNYFTHLRVRPGGDYGYREITHDIVQSIRSNKTTRNLGATLIRPNYNSPEELLDRT